MTGQEFRTDTGGLVDRSRPLRFRFNDQNLIGYEGDTLASALLANGVHRTGASIRLGRPRGIFSAGAEEPNALVQIEEPFPEPMLPATTVELYDGLVARGLGGRGRLADRPDPARYDAIHAHCDVLVVGAGPAGMECARVLGERGMRRVHLVEGQDDMGGIMRWIPQFPGLGEWARVVNYRKIQIDKLKNVEFIPNTRLDADGVKNYGAEIVIVATGGYWATDGLNGCTHDTIPGADASQAWCATPEQIMAEGKAVGDKVLIVDNDGYFTGVSLAEKLAEEGKQVTLMTHLGHIAPYMHFTLEAPNMHRKLHKLKVEIVTYQVPTEMAEGQVTSAHVYDEEHLTEWGVDSVVLVTQRRSNEALYRELKDSVGIDALESEGITGFYRIGDCVAPRLVADCIFDGHRLAREIDSENPEVPLPFKRERHVIEREAVLA